MALTGHRAGPGRGLARLLSTSPTTGRQELHAGGRSRLLIGAPENSAAFWKTVVCSSRTATELYRSPSWNSELSPQLSPIQQAKQGAAAPSWKMSPFLCQDQVGMQPGTASILPTGGHLQSRGTSKRQGASQTGPRRRGEHRPHSAWAGAPLGAARVRTTPPTTSAFLTDLRQQEGGVNTAQQASTTTTPLLKRETTVRVDGRLEPAQLWEMSPPTPTSQGPGSSMAPRTLFCHRGGREVSAHQSSTFGAAADPKGHRKDKESRLELKVLLPQGSGELSAAEKSQLAAAVEEARASI